MKVFAGGGEMGALMRDKDWSATPLGPPGRWPRSLRAVIRILLTSRYAMWMSWGPELTFLYNDAYAKMTLGSKHPWALGRPSREVWAEIWPQIGPRIDKVLTTGEATWDERLLLFLERSGYPEETYHTFSYSPLADDEGTIRGHLCVVTEETDRVIDERHLGLLKELGARLANAKTEDDVFQAAVQSIATDPRPLPFSLVYLFAPDGRARLVSSSGVPESAAAPPAIMVNDLASSWGLTGTTWESTQVMPAPVFVKWTTPPWHKASDHVFMVPIRHQAQSGVAGVFIVGANPFRRVDEKYRSFVDLFVGQVTAGLANVRAYEEERRRAEALTELDRAKTVFFSNVSHEFRTPLTLMLGPTEDAMHAEDRALRGEDLDTVYRNQVRLLKLVNTLLDFSRIEAGRMAAAFEPVDLAQLTAELAGVFRSAIERGGLVLEVDCPRLPEPVSVDRDMWEKIVLNLLSNAFKFTFEGTIRVTLRSENGQAVLRVSDTGVGVAPEQLPRLFERFHRVEGARARTHEGSGIGLALVRDLVALHGGTIHAASELGRGATFTVTVPFERASAMTDRLRASSTSSPSASGRAAAAYVAEAERWLPSGASISEPARFPATGTAGEIETGKNGRVLIADDNADMREYAARLLRSFWTVEAVADGQQALDAIRRNPPDLLLTDVMMPTLDGLGLLNAIRADSAISHLPVIMLSARAGEEAQLEGLQSGADDYLVKPFSARELIARVGTHLGLGRARRQALADLEEHTAALETAHHRLEQATRAKDEFLAMLGHELRNPLAPILTALQLMQLKGASHSEERMIIERQTKHLVRLVDDLLDVSRIARGKIELKKERVQVGAVVARAIELASPLFESRNQTLDVSVPATGLPIDADPSRLAQAVANLLTNASKYTERTGHIAIRAERTGDDILIAVRDDGIGIAGDMLPRVFDMFVQEGQALDRSQGGLGLGLAIVRSIMALHRGTASVTSDGPGTGSEFVLRIPAAHEGESVTTSELVATGVVTGLVRAGVSVLIVDDNDDAAAMLAETLALNGHQVRLAADGPSALRLVRHFKPAVALLDIGLPGMDGYELAARLRNDGLASVRLIAVTGYGQAADRRRSEAVGFDAHLVKPVDVQEVERTIRSLIEQ